MRLAFFAVVAILLAASPAAAIVSNRVSLDFVDHTSSAPLYAFDSHGIGASNGSATFTGSGYAYPGQLEAHYRCDMTWANGSSGGAGTQVLAFGRTEDFVISGPAAPSVAGTLHFRLTASLTRLGGFAGNGAHGSSVDVYANANFNVNVGHYDANNFGYAGSGVLTGLTGDAIDVPFTISGNFPVGGAFAVEIRVTAGGSCYGNDQNANPGFVATDADLSLDEVSGQVMTLPAGYTLNAPSWWVADNHYSRTVAVEPAIAASDLALSIAPNPAAGAQRLALTLPRAGEVHVAIFDAGGRRVRALADGRFAAGASTLAWDGRDDRGAHVRAGLYFARVSAADRVISRRIVRLE